MPALMGRELTWVRRVRGLARADQGLNHCSGCRVRRPWRPASRGSRPPTGFYKGDLDERRAQAAASLCIAAGTEEFLIPQWGPGRQAPRCCRRSAGRAARHRARFGEDLGGGRAADAVCGQRRAEVRPDRLRIEVEDAGGPWRDRPRNDGRPHGFDVVTAIAGPGKWGIDGDASGRIAWVTLGR
jgi:hypothetical protein